jgi:hypothetical protein
LERSSFLRVGFSTHDTNWRIADFFDAFFYSGALIFCANCTKVALYELALVLGYFGRHGAKGVGFFGQGCS